MTIIQTLFKISYNLVNNKWRAYLPFILIFTFHPNLYANNLSSVNHLTNVSKIIQDKQGFIWLAGQQGLTRFDNNESITFSSSNQQWPLAYTWLHDVAKFQKKLLVATEGNGLWQFDPKTGNTSPVLTQIKNKSIYNITVFSGIYFINVPNSLYRFDPKTGISTLIKDNIVIRSIVHTNKYLYVSTKEGLYRLSKNNKKLNLVIKNSITAMSPLSTQIIFSTKKDIYSLNDDGVQLKINHKNKIYALTADNNNENFFTINDKGKIGKYSGKTLATLPHNYPDTSPAYIRSMLHDNSGVLWLVSNKGIIQLNENTLKNYSKTFELARNANEIALLENQLIIGSYGLGLQNFKAPVFNDKTNNVFSSKGLKITDLLTHNSHLYIATFDGLWIYNLTNNQVKKVNFSNNNKLLLKLTTKDNKLYIATNYHGFYVYDLKSKKIINHVSKDDGLSSNEVLDILPLNNGDIWLTTTTGIDVYYNTTGIVKNILVPGPNKAVSLIYADNKIFAATLGDGIFAFNLQGEALHHFAKGIRFTYMQKIDGEIWAPARPGLYRFNPKNYKLSMVPNTEVYSFVGSSQIKDNNLYLPHYAGVLAVQLKKTKTFNSKIYISRTNISGKQYLLNKSINTKTANDVVGLSLTSLDYRNGIKKQFKYRINNGIWNKVQGSQLTLTGLSSGIYNVEIMGTNSLGQWSSNHAYTQVIVAYPWYWTPQIRIFYLILMFLLIAITFWLLFLRTRSISKIHKLLTLNIQSRGKSATTVSHNLTMAITQLKQNKTKNNEIIELLQESISELNTSSSITEPDNLDGKSLFFALDYLSNYIQKKYHSVLINQISVEENIISRPLQADIYKIVYEAIISATLNGNSRSFTLSLKEHKSKLWLTIQTDNDSFIQFNNKVNFNLPMYYIRQIAKKNNASINTYAQDSEGSQLLMSIPLMNKFI